jgi:putative transposase
MNYRRYYIPDATVFIVGVTKNRISHFMEEQNITLFKETLERTKEKYPFELPALVILPDHFHLLLKPVRGNFSQIMLSFKKRFTDNFKKRNGILTNFSLWQGRFWDHVIRNDEDFKKHLDYIHYNSVKHGYVSRPEDWQHSSYLTWVKRGEYGIGWGHTEIEDLREMSFE